MNIKPLDKELKDDKKDLTKLPYETPPDVVDVGSVLEENRDRLMRQYAVLSSIAYQVYNNGKEKAGKKLNEFLPNHQLIPELSDGYSSTIIKKRQDKPDEIIVAYRGTQNLKDAFVDLTNIAIGSPIEKIGGIPTGYFRIAQDKYDAVKQAYPNAVISTTGHSLGGSLAYYIGKKNDVRSYIYNAGSSPLDIITDTGFTHTANNKSTHYYVPADIVGASKALIGSNQDELVMVQPHKWVRDIAGSIAGAALAGSAVSGGVGAIVGAIVGGALGIATVFDLHGLHNFLPPETFKENLEEDDIAYEWVKPIDDAIKQQSRISTRGQITNLSSSKIINKKEFVERINKLCNPADPLSKCYRKF
jgi:hypothetical protein